MKKQNAMELNEQFKDCPTESHEYEIEGRKYIVVSHFTGTKDLDDVVFRNAYSQAMNEMLRVS